MIVVAVVVVIMVVVGIVVSLVVSMIHRGVMRVFMFAMMSPAPSVTVTERETLSGTKARHSRQDGTGQDI